MAGTALAMMLVPLVIGIMFMKKKKLFIISNLFIQLIHMLLDTYGFRGTILIAGGWALHSVVGSCLLRPLEERSSTSVEVIILILKILNCHSLKLLTSRILILNYKEYVYLRMIILLKSNI